MKRILRRWLPAGSALLFIACDHIGSPSNPGPVSSVAAPRSATDSLTASNAQIGAERLSLPAWVNNPQDFAPGLMGRNNCTFPLGAAGAQWDFHPDGACWERPGPDGWTRQQQHRVHVPTLAICGGGSGDVSPIRVCRPGGAGQPNPCFINAATGPNGCALCVVDFTCH
jgi:hypothetical protein